MAWFEFIWLEGDEGNIEHIAEHGISMDDFEHVFDNYSDEDVSRSSGRPLRFGYTEDGRYIAVVFEWIVDDVEILPVTAYEV
jgi:uncharacterized DUF497 family protein